jgi:hypothetical protein
MDVYGEVEHKRLLMPFQAFFVLIHSILM